jgi:hypothetical protein
VENIDGQTIKQKHDILGRRRGPIFSNIVNSPLGCMLRLLIGYMKHFWPGLMAGAQKLWDYSVVDVN